MSVACHPLHIPCLRVVLPDARLLHDVRHHALGEVVCPSTVRWESCACRSPDVKILCGIFQQRGSAPERIATRDSVPATICKARIEDQKIGSLA